MHEQGCVEHDRTQKYTSVFDQDLITLCELLDGCLATIDDV